MILEKIKEANDVKQLSLSECEQLAQEIRDFLIRSLSETGGHLALLCTDFYIFRKISWSGM